MAYVNKEKKAKIAAAVEEAVNKYPGLGFKYTLKVSDGQEIVMTIRKGRVDLIDHVSQVVKKNADFWSDSALSTQNLALRYRRVCEFRPELQFEGEVLEFMREIISALNTDNFDKSDSQSDYFYVGHYVDLRIGAWDKPFEVVK